MKKIKELTYNNNVKLTKKNYLIMIIPIILVLILIIAIAIFVVITNSNSHKLKNYLEEQGYLCNRKTCLIQNDNNTYTFDYIDIIFSVDNDNYHLTISKAIPTLEIKNNEYICNYQKEEYEIFTLVDSSFIYDKQCSKYIEDINNNIEKYKAIVNNTGIDVNTLDK